MMKKAYENSPHKYLINLFNKSQVINQLEDIKLENSPENPVIRLGKLTGYFTHSIGLSLAKDKNRPYNIKEYGKLLFKNRAKDWLFPLTRRLTLDNQTLGWCQISVKKEEQNKKKDSKENSSSQNKDELLQKLLNKYKKY